MPSQVKTVIMEIAEVGKPVASAVDSDDPRTLQLYTNRFPELFTSTSSIGPFVQAVWALVGDGKRPSVADDTVCQKISSFFLRLINVIAKLVAQSLRFLSTAIRSGLFRDLFSNRDTIKTLVNGVVVPNVELRGEFTSMSERDNNLWHSLMLRSRNGPIRGRSTRVYSH